MIRLWIGWRSMSSTASANPELAAEGGTNAGSLG